MKSERNQIIRKLNNTPPTLVPLNPKLRKHVQQIIRGKLKTGAAQFAINDAAASICGQITSGLVLVDSWAYHLLSMVHQTTRTCLKS